MTDPTKSDETEATDQGAPPPAGDEAPVTERPAAAVQAALRVIRAGAQLSLSGGLVGTVIGVAIPLSVRLFIDVKIPVSPWAAIVALAPSVVVGVVFGTLPASRAAKLDPVSTLKYE